MRLEKERSLDVHGEGEVDVAGRGEVGTVGSCCIVHYFKCNHNNSRLILGVIHTSERSKSDRRQPMLRLQTKSKHAVL